MLVDSGISELQRHGCWHYRAGARWRFGTCGQLRIFFGEHGIPCHSAGIHGSICGGDEGGGGDEWQCWLCVPSPGTPVGPPGAGGTN
jgi:hypothetical protein